MVARTRLIVVLYYVIFHCLYCSFLSCTSFSKGQIKVDKLKYLYFMYISITDIFQTIIYHIVHNRCLI